jgi:hypothetical protein
MSRADELRAELALLELEDEYVAAKESGADREALKALGLREARQAFREQREGATVASPDVIQVTTEVPEV